MAILNIHDFALTRHAIWLRKTYGITPDMDTTVLDGHHYTNIWRELDRNSIYLFNEVQGKTQEDFNESILDTIRFRLFNKIDTNEALLTEFGSLDAAFADHTKLYAFLKDRKANFTGAYVRCPDLAVLCKETSNDKLQPIADQVYTALILKSRKSAWNTLRSVFSIGDFLTDQLLMDLTWIGGLFDTEIAPAAQFFTPQPGPGARAGLQYAVDTNQGDWDQLLDSLAEAFQSVPMPLLSNGSQVPFDERTLEHTLCEYFKHVKFESRGDKQVKMRKYTPATFMVDALPYTWQAPIATKA